jgi:hypothetical protein
MAKLTFDYQGIPERSVPGEGGKLALRSNARKRTQDHRSPGGTKPPGLWLSTPCVSHLGQRPDNPYP